MDYEELQHMGVNKYFNTNKAIWTAVQMPSVWISGFLPRSNSLILWPSEKVAELLPG